MIRFVGHNCELHVVGEHFVERAPSDAVEVLGGFILPGLWDSHLHFLLWALKRSQVNLTGVTCAEDFLARVSRGCPGEWLQGQGWTEVMPTLDQLDAVTGDRPTILWRTDLHSALVNSAALAVAGITRDTPDPPGGRLQRRDGKLTGVLRELAVNLVSDLVPQPTAEEVDGALQKGCAHLHSLGVTGIHDQRFEGHWDGALSRAAYQRLRLPLRIHCNIGRPELERLPPEGPGYRTGHAKFFSDGSLGSRTAAMLRPYEGESQHRGLWLTPPAELRRGFVRARELGLPISVHAIGDAAVREVLDIFQALGPSQGIPDRIEHVQIATLEDVARLAPLGLTASMQPLHLLDDMDIADALLGERAQGYYRLATLARHGTRLAFGSDGPVTDVSPWLGLHAAVTRTRPYASRAWYPEECLDLATALSAYTRQAAEAVGRNDLGALKPGCLADFVVVDREPTESNLLDVRVLRTVVGGRTVFQA